MQDTACSRLSPLCQWLCCDLLQLNTLTCASSLPPAPPARSAGTGSGHPRLHTRTKEGTARKDKPGHVLRSGLSPSGRSRLQEPLAEAEWVWEPGPCSMSSSPRCCFPSLLTPSWEHLQTHARFTGPDGISSDALAGMSPGLVVRLSPFPKVARSVCDPAGLAVPRDGAVPLRGREAACLFLSHLHSFGCHRQC